VSRVHGEGASPGIAIGPAYFLAAKVAVAERRILRLDRAAEVAHLEEGIATADEQLDRLQRLLAEGKGAGADLVQAHRLMLRSPEIAGESRRLILEECCAAEWAVTRALDGVRAVFSQIRDPYFRERGGDFEAVGERLVRALLGLPELRADVGAHPGAIAIGADLAPFDPFRLQAAGIVGIVTENGGKTSHTAIIARALNLPYVAGCKHLANRIQPGTLVIVDGARGDVIVDPSDEIQRSYRDRAAAERRREEELLVEKDQPAVTTDGASIRVSANVESLIGVAAVTAAGADGIGLFRTEFLYLERPDLPTEDEQFRDAVSVLQSVSGLTVTFRTLDLGGDKLPLAFTMPEGPNPALGVRSLRFSIEQPDIFRTQLRALYRASAFGPMRVMLPLVTSATELEQALAICLGVRESLEAEGIAHDRSLPIGVMIETPAAAVTADLLARSAKFFSIGTNDLIQYSCAADRENADVAHLRDPLQPAILRLLKQTIDAAVAAGIPVSICGDMAGEPSFTWLLLGLGLRDLSMEPHAIPAVKAVIRRSSMAEAEVLARKALASSNERETAGLIEAAMGQRFGDQLGAFVPAL
jgi:phosphotransferase system enzyme I (PtsI)